MCREYVHGVTITRAVQADLAVQEVRKGFTWGQVTITPLLDDEDEDAGSANATPTYCPDDRLVIPFQNENLYAYLTGLGGVRKVRVQAISPPSIVDSFTTHQMLATVPDLITVIDSQNGTALGTPDYR